MSTSLFERTHSLGLRIWHWLTAVVIFCLLLTILFRNTFLNSSSNSKIIFSELQKSGITISDHLALCIAKSIRQPFWEWHYYFGFALFTLALLRASVFFLQHNKTMNLRVLYNLPKEDQKDAKHYLMVRRVYTLFYLLLTTITLTGLLMYFKVDIGLAKATSRVIKTIHEYTMWGIIPFIVFHIIGVVLAEKNIKNKGIVSTMINGGK
jgi:Ni/Fe-hydrogenase 1 B-type cytochrome subunit